MGLGGQDCSRRHRCNALCSQRASGTLRSGHNRRFTARGEKPAVGCLNSPAGSLCLQFGSRHLCSHMPQGFMGNLELDILVIRRRNTLNNFDLKLESQVIPFATYMWQMLVLFLFGVWDLFIYLFAFWHFVSHGVLKYLLISYFLCDSCVLYQERPPLLQDSIYVRYRYTENDRKIVKDFEMGKEGYWVTFPWNTTQHFQVIWKET